MSRQELAKRLREAFIATRLGWVLRLSDSDAVLRGVAREFQQFIEEYGRRFPDEPPPDPFALLAANPEKAAAFFQTFAGAPLSPDIRVMVWRLIHGAEIEEMDFHYSRTAPFEMKCRLSSESKSYRSEDLWDFRILRHMGLLAIDDKPILDGFYAQGSLE